MDLKKVLEEYNEWYLIVLDQNKKPLIKNWNSKTKEELFEEISNRFLQKSGISLGALTGAKNGFLVVDIDVKDGGMKTWTKLMQEHEKPNTPTVRSGGGGLHFYFKYSESVSHLKTKSKIHGTGIDLKTNGGYIILPPSLHKSGRKYEWVEETRHLPMIEMPHWLIKYLEKDKK